MYTEFIKTQFTLSDILSNNSFRSNFCQHHKYTFLPFGFPVMALPPCFPPNNVFHTHEQIHTFVNPNNVPRPSFNNYSFKNAYLFAFH